MKSLIDVLGFIVIIPVQQAHADKAAQAGACYAIADPHVRAVCRAKAHGNPSLCYIIQKPDLRAQCMAEARK